MAKKQTTTKKTSVPKKAASKDIKQQIADRKARVDAKKAELKKQEEALAKLEKQREGDIGKFRKKLKEDTQNLLKKILTKDPSVEKLGTVILSQYYYKSGDRDDEGCDVYRYTYVFKKIELDPLDKDTYKSEGDSSPIVELRFYSFHDEAEKLKSFEKTIGKDGVIFHSKTYSAWNFWSLPYIITYFYRQNGDIDKAILEARKLFDTAMEKGKGDSVLLTNLFETLYDMS